MMMMAASIPKHHCDEGAPVFVGPQNCDEKCAACNKIAVGPHVASCGHVFGAVLFRKLQKQDVTSFVCPGNNNNKVCGCLIATSELLPDQSLVQTINRKRILCVNANRGCESVMPYNKLSQHRGECPHEPSKCTIYMEPVERRLLSNHREMCGPSASALTGLLQTPLTSAAADDLTDPVQNSNLDGSGSVVDDPHILNDEGSTSRRPVAVRQMSELGIVTETGKHPDFAVESRREATFLTWPSTNEKLAAEMIQHFLFYTGTGDTVCCYSCGVEMSKWTSIENIWVRHARQSPSCQLLLHEQGQDFVTSVLTDHGRYQEPPKESAINVVTVRRKRPRFDSPVTQSTLMLGDPGYSRDDVRNALIDNIKYGPPDFETVSSLVKSILAKKDDLQALDGVREILEDGTGPPAAVISPNQIIINIKYGPPDFETVSSLVKSILAKKEEAREAIEDGTGPPAVVISPNQITININALSGGSGETKKIRRRELKGYLEVLQKALSSMDDEEMQEAAETGAESEDIRALATQMKSQLVCKICIDAVVGIIFLPCGHMVCCATCAAVMVKCPICRQKVCGTIKTTVGCTEH